MKKNGSESFAKDVRSKQSNILWPDGLHNGISVDKLLWKGSPNATLVQRVGIGIFGIAFLLFAAFFAQLAYRDHSIFWLLFTLCWIYIGARVFRNAFRK
jgi:hypothetical protein